MSDELAAAKDRIRELEEAYNWKHERCAQFVNERDAASEEVLRIREIAHDFEAELATVKAERDAAIAHITELSDAYHEEVNQFNLGHDAFYAGVSSDDAPRFDTDYDVWTCGWAWGKFIKDESDQSKQTLSALLADALKERDSQQRVCMQVMVERDSMKDELLAMQDAITTIKLVLDGVTLTAKLEVK